MFSPDGFGRGEDQAENSRSHTQREMSDLPHPPPPQPLCHRCPGCLLLQHLRSHHLLPAGTNEWYKGRETNINSPGIIILPAGGVKELHLICSAGELHGGSHLWVPPFNCYHHGQLHHPPPLLCDHQLWGLLTGLWDPLHSHEVLLTESVLITEGLYL